MGKIKDFQVIEVFEENDHDRRGKNRRQEQDESIEFAPYKASRNVIGEKERQRNR